MSLLYLLGGRQRKRLLNSEDESRLYGEALTLRVDTVVGTANLEVQYKSPPEVCAGEGSSHVFKSATLLGNRFYTCTSTDSIDL
jgi:hypothetical protein